MAKENTLVYRAQTGDEGAFADLMRAYHAFVYAIVIGMVDNSHDAEEVVQDTFLSAYRGLTQLEDAAKFKIPDFLVKMRREEGMWRIYRYGWDR